MNNASDDLVNDDTWTYTYDSEGNLTERSKGASLETWNYAYDHRNQLTQVEQRATDGGTLQLRATYSYDVFGNRIEKRVDSDGDLDVDVHQKYAYNGDHVWADLDGGGSLKNRYVHGDVIDQVFIRINDEDDPFWYLTDRLGSVRNLTDDNGDLLSTHTYDAFGKLLNSPAIDERLGHTGLGDSLSRLIAVIDRLRSRRARGISAGCPDSYHRPPGRYDTLRDGIPRSLYQLYPPPRPRATDRGRLA